MVGSISERREIEKLKQQAVQLLKNKEVLIAQLREAQQRHATLEKSVQAQVICLSSFQNNNSGRSYLRLCVYGHGHVYHSIIKRSSLFDFILYI